jgi:hypothetical protein
MNQTTDKLQLIRVIDKISLQHTTQKFQSEIEKQIPELAVKEKDLLYIDPAKPLVVKELHTWLVLRVLHILWSYD